MKQRAIQLLTACIVATCLASVPAGADVLIESHPGQRPGDADVVLAAFRAELETLGVKVRAADVLAIAGDQLPLPGSTDPTLGREYAIELSGQVALGTKQVFHGDYAIGLHTLADVLARVRANPSVVVLDTSSPAWLTKAYAAIAFAQLRSQQVVAATEAVTEQIRSFPDDPIGRSVGPEVAALAADVRKTLDAAPHGRLQILASHPDVAIFVDERPSGQGHVDLAAVPGVYRLLLVRDGVSRRYASRVLPDKTTTVNVDWDADVAFHAAGDWVGFAWPSGQKATLATAVTRYAHGARAHDLVVASIVVHAERRFLSAAIFEKQTGALLRTKVILLGRDDAACKRALAQYVMTGSESVCLLDVPAPAAPQPRVLAERSPQRSRAPIYAAAGTALAAFIVGGYLFHLDGSGTCGARFTIDCPLIYSTRGTAWTFLGVGVAAVGFGVYWQFHTRSDAQSSASLSLHPTAQGALASVGGTF